jgi:hypothetical protein
MVFVHDVQDVIPDTLSVAGALADHRQHLPEEVSRGQEVLLVLAKEANELATDLIGEGDLCPLKVFGLRVVILLPGKLPVEAVSQPYKEERDMISIALVNTRLKHVSACVVPMHQSPRTLHISCRHF